MSSAALATTRLVRQVMYDLKRRFGCTVVLHQLQSSDTNYANGVKTYSTRQYSVRAAVLPTMLTPEQHQSISVISANKMFVYGGLFHTNSRVFLIDARDLPSGFQLSLDDFMVYGGQRYNPKNIEILELGSGWLVATKADANTRISNYTQPVTSNDLLLEEAVAVEVQ